MKPAVLFVDDEPNILKALGRLFRGEDFEIKTAESGADALKLMEDLPVQILVSDHRMPGMTGVDLLSKVRERWPEVIRILVTGNSEINIAVDAINRGQIFKLVTKPWNDDEIKAIVKEALDLYMLKGEIKRLNYLTQEQNLELKDLHHNLEQKVMERTRDLTGKNADLGLAYVGTLRAVVGAVDAQHRCASRHSERVGIYTGMIARRMGLEEPRVRRMHIAGLLHDVGIIGIRGEIFGKQGPLSSDEMKEMKEHPLLSVQILGTVAWLQDILSMVRDHHEWFDGDGRGYPGGLKGDAINPGARIIRVADVIEAMTHDRPYRKAHPLDRVIDTLKKFSGSAFDPDVARCAVDLIEEGEEEFVDALSRTDFFQAELDFDTSLPDVDPVGGIPL